MTKTISRLFAALLLIGISVSSQAQTLIDYGVPAKLFQVGVRAGFNTSNLTTNYDDAFQDIKWNHNQWKGGFSAGMVVDINLRNFSQYNREYSWTPAKAPITILSIPTMC